jgi:uncharacterized protein YdeI (YjbR/CyaY-like superfamily)
MLPLYHNMQNRETDVFYPASHTAWRSWLAKNHETKEAVWLVLYNKASNKETISWSEAVDVALCYGWIDSKKIKIDAETCHQFFCKRKPKSTWSKINKEKVQKLMEQGLMTPAGLACIETAQQNGSWTLLDDVEALVIPLDLEQEFRNNPDAGAFFQSLSKSSKKAILHWVVMAKRPETRQKRIAEIIAKAAQKQKPGHIR